jgi:hypothetical protein
MYFLKATVEGEVEVEAIRSRAQHAAHPRKCPRKVKSWVSVIADAQHYEGAKPPVTQHIARTTP